MSDYSKGGNDTFNGASDANTIFYGDAGRSMSGHAQGGDDHYTDFGGTIQTKTFFGDASLHMSDFAKGGDDTFTSVGGFVISFYGDAAGIMSDSASGGDDVAVLQGTHNFAYGDAGAMAGNAVGGNDILTGGNKSSGPDVQSELYGDTFAMSGSAAGGNDILTGGLNSGSGQVRNFLCGDALQMSGSARGGNDTLYAGTAAPGCTVINDMWGDGQLSELAQGGRDQFIFKDDVSMTVGTQNTIYDFSQTQDDTIVFSGVEGVQSFDDLTIAQSGTDTIITAGLDQVTLANFTSPLTTGDFLFV
ncbi:hypothetical protein [Mesorhizobium sp. M0898]|uniref:hypothetical protein n=1 Tax=Mesorhizobium sp. M0898 TaxID=2957020 RepID=UPI00333B662F